MKDQDKATFEKFKAENPHLFDSGKLQEELAKAAPQKVEQNTITDQKFLQMCNKKRKPTTPEQKQALRDYTEKVKQMPTRIQYINKTIEKKPLMPLAEAKAKVWKIMCELMQKQGREYIFDKYNRTLIAELTKYFTWQDGCAYDINKGLWLFGPVGAGKTFLMEVFEIFTTRYELPTAFRSHNMKTIAGACQGEGYKELYKYYQGFVCLDDVGIEQPVRHMGNSICCFTEMITELYKRHTKSGKIAIVTTNLFPESLVAHYGERVEDRIKQLFTFVCLGGESKR